MSVEDIFIDVLKKTGLEIKEVGKWLWIEEKSWITKKDFRERLLGELSKLVLSVEAIKGFIDKWVKENFEQSDMAYYQHRFNLAQAIQAAQPLVKGGNKV